MTELPDDDFEELSARVDDLEERVTRLERGAPAAVRTSIAAVPASQAAPPASVPPVAGIFAVLGQALLGIAGAYVLRALTAGNILPRPLIAVLAILYALGWLLASARVVVRKRFTGALYAATSALILAPMLWEMCLRFQVLSPSLAAAVLALYAAAATAIGLRDRGSSAFFFAYAGGALMAVALAVATHAMAQFTAILLAMLLICEAANLLDRRLAVSPLIVLAADFAVWATLFIYRAPAATRADYPALNTVVLLALACLPFLISVPGIAIRTLGRQQDMHPLDIVQGMLSFVLLALGFLWLLPMGVAALSVVCLALGLACYTATLGPFRRAAHPLNFNVCAVWSAALLLTGVFLAFHATSAALVIGAASLAGILLGDRLHNLTAELHGVLYLAVAAALSGQLLYVRQALVGRMPSLPEWPILLVSILAIADYALGDERPGEPWRHQAVHLVAALLAAAATAALLAHGLVGLAGLFVEPADFHIAFLRTLTLCAVALGLAFAAAQWHRLELKRVAYTALAFVAAKLLFEDLRHGRMEFIAGSIFLVALTLIAVPRMAQRTPAAAK